MQAYFSRIGAPWTDGNSRSSPDEPLDVTNNSPSYWLDILREAKGERADKARERLIAMGVAAILELKKALRDPDPRLRVLAASILGEMGEHATAAVPELAKSLSDNDAAVRAGAARSLGKLGVIAHPALVALIIASHDPQVNVRNASAEALPKIGPVIADDVAKLPALWAEKDTVKRRLYLATVLNLKPNAALAATILAPLIADGDKGIRLQAIRATESAGPPARTA